MKERVTLKTRILRRLKLWSRLLQSPRWWCRRRKRRPIKDKLKVKVMEEAHRLPKLNHRQEPSTRVQQSVRTQPSVQDQPSVRAQPSASAGHSTAQTIPRALQRVELQALGPADNAPFQEGGALRRGSAFPRGFRFPGPGVFRIRRSNEARAWDFEPSFSMRIFRRTIQIGRNTSCLGIQ